MFLCDFVFITNYKSNQLKNFVTEKGIFIINVVIKV